MPRVSKRGEIKSMQQVFHLATLASAPRDARIPRNSLVTRQHSPFRRLVLEKPLLNGRRTVSCGRDARSMDGVLIEFEGCSHLVTM